MSPAARRAFCAGWAAASADLTLKANPHGDSIDEASDYVRWVQGFRAQLTNRVAARSYSYLVEKNTGVGPRSGDQDRHGPTYLQWAENQVRKRRQRDDTAQLAEILEAHGVPAHQAKDGIVTGLSLVTRQTDTVDDYRNVNILPSVAARNRSPVVAQITYWLEKNPHIRKYVRYGVFTSGTRVPLYGDARERETKLHRSLSRWAHWARTEFGIEALHRSTESTVDAALSLHVHANLLYWPTRKLTEAEWMRFRDGSEVRNLGTWRDNGRVKDVRELVKYVLKGDDLALLVDAAELVPEWSGHGDPSGYAYAVAKRMAAECKASDPGPWLLDGHRAAMDMRARLTELHRAGAPHPIVWLAEQLHGLRLNQSMGPLAAFRADLRERGRKVTYEQTPRGPVLVEYQKPKRGKEKSVSSPLADENRIIAFTLAHPRHTPWAEPVVLVRNYNPRPSSVESAASLQLIEDFAAQARAAWDRNGAPEPRQALAHAVMAMSAVDGPQGHSGPGGGLLAGSGAAPLYGSQSYDNCPRGKARSAGDGTVTDMTTGEVLAEPSTGAALELQIYERWPELDPFHPENWLPYDGEKKPDSIPTSEASYFERMRSLGVRDSIEDHWRLMGIDLPNTGSIPLSQDDALAIMTSLFDVKGASDERR